MLTTVIKTVRGREHWLYDCLRSIPEPRPVIVVRCAGYEPGGLHWIMANTTLQRWLYIQDSVTVTPDLYGMLDNTDSGSYAINDCPAPFGAGRCGSRGVSRAPRAGRLDGPANDTSRGARRVQPVRSKRLRSCACSRVARPT